MKSIINGKRYDTDKATLVASASGNAFRHDFDWWAEELYKTPRSGAFFIAGEGNANSRYATNHGGGSWGHGSKITPLTRAEAIAWAEKHIDADKIEAIFADDIQDA